MKKFAATLLCIYLAAHLSACTSKESREDDTTPPAEETAAVDSELEKVDGAPTDEASAGFVDDQLPEQALGEAPAADAGTATADAAGTDSTGLDLGAPAETAPGLDAGAVASTETPATTSDGLDLSTPAPEAPVAETTPEVSSPSPSTSTSTETPVMAEAPVETPAAETKTEVAAAPKVVAPLQKVKDTPSREGGQLLNAYYIARPGDNYKKIARMIYGNASKQKDLKEANPGVKNVKAGNKIYYNSPTRPTDELAMKSYYEDQGMQSEVYVTKEGDDLKKVSKELLGYDGAWKEVWATNKDVESKGALTAGTELRYFKSAPKSETKVAKNDMAAPTHEEGAMPPMDTPPAPDMATASNPPPPEPPTSEFPPPPDMNQGAAGAAAGSMAMNEPPPPPPPPEMAPPPPPPPVEMAPPPPPVPMAKAPKGMGAAEGFSNDDMMMGLGAVGILAAGIAAIMVIRKRRQQKEMASAFGDTQVGA